MPADRRVLWLLLLLLPIEFLERSAYYGHRSVLSVWLTDQALSAHETSDLLRLTTRLVYSTPVLGAIAAVAIGPRFALPICAAIATLGYALLALAAGPLSAELGTEAGVTLSLVVLALGAGMLKPCVVAALADGFPDPFETARNAAFVAFYFAVNLGAAASTLAAPRLFESAGAAPVFGISAALLAVVVVLSLALALAWRFDRPKREPPPEPQPDGGWWRALLGAAVVMIVALPFFAMIEASTLVMIRSGEPMREVWRWQAWNPLIVCGTAIPLTVALAVLAFLRIRVRALLLIGFGLCIASIGLVPQVLQPLDLSPAIVAVFAVAVGEAFASPLFQARVLGGHHWRVKALVATALLGAIALASALAGLAADLARDDADGSIPRMMLVGTASLVFFLGAGTAAFHGPLSRLFWPETETAE